MLHEHATSTPARLVLECEVAGATPEEMTRAFTDPDRIRAWWAPRVDISADGEFIYRWPDQEWTLRGRFLERVPGRRVRFTWQWEHEPLVAARTVLITTTATEGGTRLTITHGDYGPDDADERQGHADGWRYFVGKLAGQFEAAPSD
jgi:uncharacterized protein YndB with AHSA1/START domain